MHVTNDGFVPRQVFVPKHPSLGALAAQSAFFFVTTTTTIPTPTPAPIPIAKVAVAKSCKNKRPRRSKEPKTKMSQTQEDLQNDATNVDVGRPNTNTNTNAATPSSRFRFVSKRSKTRRRIWRIRRRKAYDKIIDNSIDTRENLASTNNNTNHTSGSDTDSETNMPKKKRFCRQEEHNKEARQEARNRPKITNRSSKPPKEAASTGNDDNEATRIMKGIIAKRFESSSNKRTKLGFPKRSHRGCDSDYSIPSRIETEEENMCKNSESKLSHQGVDSSYSTPSRIQVCKNSNSFCNIYKKCFCEDCFNVDLEWGTKEHISWNRKKGVPTIGSKKTIDRDTSNENAVAVTPTRCRTVHFQFDEPSSPLKPGPRLLVFPPTPFDSVGSNSLECPRDERRKGVGGEESEALRFTWSNDWLLPSEQMGQADPGVLQF